MEQDIKTENEKLYQVCSKAMMRAKIIPRSFMIFLKFTSQTKSCDDSGSQDLRCSVFFVCLITNSNNSQECCCNMFPCK